MFRSSMLNVLLAIALLVSALALVTTQYRARKAFVALEIARGQAEDLAARQRRLESDLASAAQPAVIDKKARRILGMESLPAERTLYLTLRAGGGAGGAGADAARRARTARPAHPAHDPRRPRLAHPRQSAAPAAPAGVAFPLRRRDGGPRVRRARGPRGLPAALLARLPAAPGRAA